MSADNYYVLFPPSADGGRTMWGVAQGFASDDVEPTHADILATFPSYDLATQWLNREYSEYGWDHAAEKNGPFWK